MYNDENRIKYRRREIKNLKRIKKIKTVNDLGDTSNLNYNELVELKKDYKKYIYNLKIDRDTSEYLHTRLLLGSIVISTLFLSQSFVALLHKDNESALGLFAGFISSGVFEALFLKLEDMKIERDNKRIQNCSEIGNEICKRIYYKQYKK